MPWGRGGALWECCGGFSPSHPGSGDGGDGEGTREWRVGAAGGAQAQSAGVSAQQQRPEPCRRPLCWVQEIQLER